ncbi:MAG: Hsp20/alpha crystallin family protein [Spirochaetales bacterium]|jgi:HSP20 family protein|nr:Hsp20/alpha crystallin family protein [Spirochaetales bacterium]
MRSIVNYGPSSSSLIGDIDRMFNSFVSNSASAKPSTSRVDIREDENDYVLEMELPGLSEKDVEVKIEDTLLTISSKEVEDRTEEKAEYLLKERSSRSFSRSFVLPKDADKDKIEAVFSNGLLNLSISKRPETKPKTIEIKSS